MSVAANTIKFIVGGTGLYLGGAYIAYNFYVIKRRRSDSPDAQADVPFEIQDQSDYSSAYDEIAEGYDKKIGKDEFFCGFNLLRRFIIKKAEGDILELAAGTGRNFKYFQLDKCNSFTLIDKSEPMLKEAVKTASKFLRWNKHRKIPLTPIVMESELMDFEDKSFDTVVQTFALCSYRDPAKVLKEMQRVCKEDGKILLLEHGLSKYEWLNNLLHSRASNHAKKWGCWWNRDIQKLVEESGLIIEEMTRYHFGTTYYIIAKPNHSKPIQSPSTTTVN